MIKKMKNRVSKINNEIKERQIKDFIKEFDSTSETYNFVYNCTIDNQLSFSEMFNLYTNGAINDYLYNIEEFWCMGN